MALGCIQPIIKGTMKHLAACTSRRIKEKLGLILFMLVREKGKYLPAEMDVIQLKNGDLLATLRGDIKRDHKNAFCSI